MNLRLWIRCLVIVTLAATCLALWFVSTVVWFGGPPVHAFYAIAALAVAAAAGSWADFLDYLEEDATHD